MKISPTVKRNIALMSIIILCTITIIYSNYLFIQQSVTDIEQTLLENEYEKIGWKENYMIMQELQKREIVGYIDKMKQEKPELIKEILEEKMWSEDGTKYLKMDTKIINDLKKNTSILWSTGATVSIIEFSDLECPYCIKHHKQAAHKKALEEYPEDVNFVFKNFPLPFHKNAKTEAIVAKCVEKLSGSENYFSFIDTVFDNTQGGWEWIELSFLDKEAEKLGISKTDLESCKTNTEVIAQVDREFKQAELLNLSSVPSIIIINNTTWKHAIFSGVTEYEKMKGVIEYLK